MYPSVLLLALVTVAPAALAHLAPRQTGTAAAPPAAPATNVNTAPPAPSPTNTMDPDMPMSSQKGPYKDLAACELAIDTLLRAFGMVPTPNAALGAFLATETRAVSDPCSWVSDVPSSLAGAYSAYSTDLVGVLNQNSDLISKLSSCVDAGGASVTRAEVVTPLFSLPECKEVSTSDGESSTTGPVTVTTSSTFRGFPAATTTSSSTNGVRATGVAVAGVAAAAFLGVVGAL
ncbi:hypothetical protein B0H66DRAFT_604411 [Apodospora peruviana]|uniref:Infection structure specific protein n=1 Tax=Apodospora peruviana TaxID=516989 RepID=A0AAE0I1W9_9PEZI|nr:hypothetical protein B0H66DRAFT_604411 [Apodospora peruviana]